MRTGAIPVKSHPSSPASSRATPSTHSDRQRKSGEGVPKDYDHTSFGEQDNSKLNRLIELFERFIAEDNGDMTVPIYIGNELIDEYIVNKNSRQKLRSGGHA